VNMGERYTDYQTYLKGRFGCRVQKITVDAGFSCPNRDGTLSSEGCLFCNQRGSGTGAFRRGMSIREQVEEGKRQLFRRYKARKFIAYFQAFTNTYASLDRLKKAYDEALSADDMVGLSIGTRPDCVGEPVLDLLETYRETHLVWVEYGLQSASDATLSTINRGHDFACFRDAVARTRKRGILTCAHVILGLPGEDRSHMLATARALCACGVDGVKIHLLYVVKDTPLEALYKAGRYTPLEQEAYVDLVCDFLERLSPEMVIQRLTGDPHPEELAAPGWCRDKAGTLAGIRSTLEKRNSWQGKYCTGPGKEAGESFQIVPDAGSGPKSGKREMTGTKEELEWDTVFSSKD